MIRYVFSHENDMNTNQFIRKNQEIPWVSNQWVSYQKVFMTSHGSCLNNGSFSLPKVTDHRTQFVTARLGHPTLQHTHDAPIRRGGGRSKKHISHERWKSSQRSYTDLYGMYAAVCYRQNSTLDWQ